MGQGYSILMCLNDSDDRKNDFKSFRSQKTAPGHTIHMINGVPHLSSPWPVSTDSSLYFSPSPVKFDDDEYLVSPFDIMSPSISRENEMTVVRLRELANLVQAGDIEGLAFVTSKCHLRYKDIRVDGLPLLHLAVSSNELDMVKYLITQDVDICALDKDGVSATEYSTRLEDPDIYTFLISTAMSNHNSSLNCDASKAVLDCADEDDASVSSSSSASSSYMSSMAVKKLQKKEPKKEQRKLMKHSYLSANMDGEESVDDDKSPCKGRLMQPSRLLSEQLLSPLSQSTTESTYSSIVDINIVECVEQCTLTSTIDIPSECDVDQESSRDREGDGYHNSSAENTALTKIEEEGGGKEVEVEKGEGCLRVNGVRCVRDEDFSGVDESEGGVGREDEVGEGEGERDERKDDKVALLPLTSACSVKQSKVIFAAHSPKGISPESTASSSSSFLTAKTTSKSPAFKKMKKVAGRAYSFVAGGSDKKVKTPKKK